MRKTYQHHKPSETSTATIAQLRLKVDELHSAIEKATPTCRERSVALTKLEEVAMWAIKAVVLNDPKSTPTDPVADAARAGYNS